MTRNGQFNIKAKRNTHTEARWERAQEMAQRICTNTLYQFCCCSLLLFHICRVFGLCFYRPFNHCKRTSLGALSMSRRNVQRKTPHTMWEHNLQILHTWMHVFVRFQMYGRCVFVSHRIFWIYFFAFSPCSCVLAALTSLLYSACYTFPSSSRLLLSLMLLSFSPWYSTREVSLLLSFAPTIPCALFVSVVEVFSSLVFSLFTLCLDAYV